MDDNNDNSRSSMSGSVNTEDDQKITLTILTRVNNKSIWIKKRLIHRMNSLSKIIPQ